MRKRWETGREMKMFEIDSALERLARSPAPDQLATLDEKVLSQVADHSFFIATAEPYKVRVTLVGLALLLGVAGGLVPEASASAEQSLQPLTDAGRLAPSSLLGVQ
jgi:hypothetical protein